MRKVLFLEIFSCFGILFLAYSSSFAQDVDSLFVHSHQIPINATKIWADHLSQIYVVDETNELINMNIQGQELFRFNNNTQGDLTTLDHTNPLTLLLYYKDFQTIILLDRTLNEQSRLNLLPLNIPFVSAVGLSNDNQIWIYDETSFKLKKINQEGEMLAESADISLLLRTVISPKQIVALGNWVFLNDPSKGIFIFDQFGQYHQTILEREVASIQVFEQYFFGISPNSVFSYDLIRNRKTNIQLPEVELTVKGIVFTKGFMLMHTTHNIEVFKINR